MADPVLVEVTRGRLVESRHAGAIAVASADGALTLRIGDIDRPVYPRSAIKGWQAIPLVATGAADRFGFGEAELALACASHNGERRHVETALGMLRAAGASEADLECGAHWPRLDADQTALHRQGREPGPIHNNCSGKHAGFIALARHMGWPVQGYSQLDHPVQRAVAGAIERLGGVRLGRDICGIDGCSVPTWGIPLRALARGFARFATGAELPAEEAGATARLRAACAAEPFLVAGTGRFCTEVMTAFGAAAFVKVGAEGVYCGAFPELGLGVAVKCADGAGRAAEVVMAAQIRRFLAPDGDAAALIDRLMLPAVTNWNGQTVGQLRPSLALRGQLGI